MKTIILSIILSVCIVSFLFIIFPETKPWNIDRTYRLRQRSQETCINIYNYSWDRLMRISEGGYDPTYSTDAVFVKLLATIVEADIKVLIYRYNLERRKK